MSFTIDRQSYPSPNYDARTGPIRGLVLHSGEGSRRSDLDILTDPTRGDGRVSAHYYVCKDGTIYQLVDDANRAWHAGRADGGWFLGIEDWNDASLGVETEHRHGEPWLDAQLKALAWLCCAKIRQYRIERRRVIAHRWMAPSRKQDPTDFSDRDLQSWIASLYGAAYRVRYANTYVRTAPSTTAPVAWEGRCILPAGQVIAISEIVTGEAFRGVDQWAHAEAIGGFLWLPQLEQVST